MKQRIINRISATLIGVALVMGVKAQTNVITYQGRLTDGGSPANGLYDFSFELFNDSSGGSSWAATTNTAVTVSNGLFTVQIDVGPSVFDGTDLWLEIGAVTNGGGAFTTLSPRQPITSAPYAIKAARVDASGLEGAIGSGQISDGSVTAAKIGGVLLTSQIPGLDADKIATGTVNDERLSANVALLDADQDFTAANTFGHAGNVFNGSFSGDGAGLTNVPGTLPPESVSASSVEMAANRSYIATNSGLTGFTLPVDAVLGDRVEVTSVGGGGWRVEPGSGQQIAGYDPGAVWIARESVRTWDAIACSADGNTLVAVVQGGQIFVSRDRGTSWNAYASSQNWQAVTCSSDGSRMVAVVDGGQIYASTDYGSNWTARASNRSWYTVASSSSGTRLIAAPFALLSSAAIYTSMDAGTNWTATGASRYFTDVAASADGLNLFATDYGYFFSSGGRIYGSTDGGTNWIDLSGVDRRWRSIASSDDGSRLIAGTENDKLYVSLNGGSNWFARAVSANWIDVASSASGNTFLAAAFNGALYLSVDGGTNWVPKTPGRAWQSVAASSDGTRFAAVADNGRIYTSDISVEGEAGSHIVLQFIGDGLWDIVVSPESSDALPYSTVVRDDSGGFSAETIEAASFVGNGSGLSSLNASQISSGTLSDSRLSANVAKLNAAQDFTSINTFSNAGNVFVGTFVGDGNAVSNLNVNNYSLDAVDGSPSQAVYVDVDGNVGIGTTSPSDPLHIRTSVGNDCAIRMVTGSSWSLVMEQDESSVFSIQNGGSKQFFIRSSGRVGIGTNAPSVRLHVVGNILATGTITGSSDRNMKENFSGINPQEILDRVVNMPIQRWNYIGEDIPHVGPVAQDFYGAFGVGMDDRHISMVDADGVALAAIQGLNQKLERENSELRKQLEELRQAVEQLQEGAGQ